MNGHAARPHLRDLETVGGQLLGDSFENDELPRRELHHQRHQHVLAGELPFAARAQMLFEQHALVRYVLVNDPQPFAVYGDDEARIHLSQRLQLTQAFGARLRLAAHARPSVAKGCGSGLTYSRGSSFGKPICDSGARFIRQRSDAAFELESLRLRPQGRCAQFEIAGDGCARRIHRGNHRARQARAIARPRGRNRRSARFLIFRG